MEDGSVLHPYKIIVKCNGCGRDGKVDSGVLKEKFLQGYKDRGKPYLCCSCWLKEAKSQ